MKMVILIQSIKNNQKLILLVNYLYNIKYSHKKNIKIMG